MNKFKVGDKIIRVACSWDDMPIFSEWVVSSVPNDVEVQVSGREGVNWLSNYFELVTEETNTSQNEANDMFLESDVLLPKNDEDDFTCCLGKGIETKTTEEITSDGGSSSYYFTKLPKHLIDQIVETGGIEIKDIVRYVFDNNADAFNIIKAQKRIIEHSKGKGKAGITGLYDAKKITFFANEQYEDMKNKES